MPKSKIKDQKAKLQFKNKIFEFCIVVLISASYVLNFLGCATVGETAKCIAGFSTKALEDNRKNAIRKTFDYGYPACYNRVKDTLIEKESYIYAEDPKKGMIAVYLSEQDTTAVGVFFQEIDSTHTQIEVSSNSTYAKEAIAARVFKALGPQDEERKSDNAAAQ